jgi:hypothetical protein
MDGLPKMSREQFIEAMWGQFEETLGSVDDAVNDAPDGPIINASEERVRDLFAQFRQAAYEAVLQARIEAAEAAFPPSEGLDRPTETAQGPPGEEHPDDQRSGDAPTHPVAQSR